MPPQLHAIFEELGLCQYLHAFLDQGFDTWDTVLDITESDLDVLGVKLGHRRKLQRRIANTRGLAPGTCLAYPTQTSIEEPRLDLNTEADADKTEPRRVAPPAACKRKYRRHPKPDENAPERPPSAYVLFSNKVRDELKGRHLSFTEIAKLVGENWQSLPLSEKEVFETQAHKAKQKYNEDMAEYKKTPKCRMYMQYLQEFRAKHPCQQDKDSSKRMKLVEASDHQGHGSATSSSNSRSGSGGESQPGSEPPPTRQQSPPHGQQRATSVVSAADSVHSVSVLPPSFHGAADEPTFSPTPSLPDALSDSAAGAGNSPRERLPIPSSGSRIAEGVVPQDMAAGHRHLPPFADIFDSRATVTLDAHSAPMDRTRYTTSPGPVPGSSLNGRRPSLQTETTSTASMSSTSSSYSFPRTPSNGTSLSVHAAEHPGLALPKLGTNDAVPHLTHGLHHGLFTLMPKQPLPPLATLSGPHLASPTRNSAVSFQSKQDAKRDTKFDGMSVLLKAGEIVDRRPAW